MGSYQDDLRAANRLLRKPTEPENSRIREHISAIIDLDFTKQEKKFARSDCRLRWTKRHIEIAERQYKRFLFLRLKYGQMPPNETIDELWHGHILDTEKYATDCKAIFGRFEHHYPYRGLEGKDDEKRWRRSFKERTLKHYKEEFGSLLYEIEY